MKNAAQARQFDVAQGTSMRVAEIAAPLGLTASSVKKQLCPYLATRTPAGMHLTMGQKPAPKVAVPKAQPAGMDFKMN